MQAFIIHLEKDTDRRYFMDQQLQKTRMEYEFFQGFSAKDISIEALRDLVAPGHIENPFCTAGEIGCAISHHRLHQKIVDEKIEKTIIFEDDVEIDTEQFLHVCALLEKDQNWEYVSLNYDIFDTAWREIHLWEHGGLTWFQKITRAVPVYLYRPIEILQQWYGNVFGPTLLPVLRPLHLAGCYFVTYEGAKKLLATQGKKYNTSQIIFRTKRIHKTIGNFLLFLHKLPDKHMKSLLQTLIHRQGAILILLVLILLSFISHWVWYNPLAIITNGDWWYQGYQTMTTVVVRWFNMWSADMSLGGPTLDIGMKLPVLLFSCLTQWFSLDYALGQRIFWFLPALLVNIYGSYKLFSYIFRGNMYATLGASLIYNFNVYISIVQISGHMSIAVGYALIPFLLFTFLRYIDSGERSHFILSLLTLFLMSIYEPRITFIGIGILLVTALYYRVTLRNIFFYFGGFALLIAFSLLPMLFSGLYFSNSLITQGLFGNQFMSLTNSIALFHSFWSGGELEYFSINPIPFFFFLIPILALLSLIFIPREPLGKRKTRSYFLFVLLALLGIFLTKQSDKPVPEFYAWAYDHIPLFNLYRESSKFYAILALGYAGMIGFFLFYLSEKKHKKSVYFVIICLILYTFLNLKPFILLEQKGIFIEKTIPTEYISINTIITEDTRFGRILTIPRNSRWLDYSLSHPQIQVTNLPGVSDDFKAFLASEGEIFPDTSRLKTFSYIFIRKNIGETDDDAGLSQEQYDAMRRSLDQESDLHLVFSGSYLSLYTVENNFAYLATSGTLSFQSPHNSTFGVNMTDLSSPQVLTLFQSFHPEWKLYLEPYDTISCDDPTLFTGSLGRETTYYTIQSRDTYAKIISSHTGVTLEDIHTLNPDIREEDLQVGQNIIIGHTPGENSSTTLCKTKNAFYISGELGKLWEDPIFDDTHALLYDYANQWTIDPEYIRAHYPKEYYKENPDGSIDIRMTLYFRPQSYFYLGLIISGTTLILLLGYLGYNMRRKREIILK